MTASFDRICRAISNGCSIFGQTIHHRWRFSAQQPQQFVSIPLFSRCRHKMRGCVRGWRTVGKLVKFTQEETVSAHSLRELYNPPPRLRVGNDRAGGGDVRAWQPRISAKLPPSKPSVLPPPSGREATSAPSLRELRRQTPASCFAGGWYPPLRKYHWFVRFVCALVPRTPALPFFRRRKEAKTACARDTYLHGRLSSPLPRQSPLPYDPLVGTIGGGKKYARV